MMIENWMRFRWVGYIARMDITYKKLRDYIGHLPIMSTEKWRLRWVRYVARMDITYKNLCHYTGHLVL